MSVIGVEGAAEGIVEMFNRLGVDYVFASPGSEMVPLWEFLAKYNAEGKPPFYMNLRHEGAALSMAKGYAMATGRGQVVLTHVSTGLLHGAMELRAAYLDEVPVLLVVGSNRTHDEEVYGGSPGPHYLSFTPVGGQQSLVQPYIKWGEEPQTNENTLDLIQRAYRIASTDVKGPTLLTISRELLFEERQSMRVPEPEPEVTSTAPSPEVIEELAQLLAESEEPLIFTRYLGRNRNAVSSLVELADLLAIPVFEVPGYVNFPTDHPMHMGPDLEEYLQEADLVIVIDAGGWPPWYPPKRVRENSNAKTVFVEVDPLQLKYPLYGYPSDLTVAADSGHLIPLLVEELGGMELDNGSIEARRRRWSAEHSRLRDAWHKEAQDVREEVPIDARWLSYCIDDVLDEGSVVVHETITHGGIIHRYVEGCRASPGGFYESSGARCHSGLGQGLGIALGVKLAEPERTVVALEGDGAFNYNPVQACLGAAQQHNIPFLSIIYDNACYAAMKHHPRYYPEGHSVRLDTYYGVPCQPTPDYKKLAQAYNGHAETVEDPSNLRQSLREAINKVKNGTPALLDVKLNK